MKTMKTMKKISMLIMLFAITFISCDDDNDDVITVPDVLPPAAVKATFNFVHDWDGTPVTKDDMEITDYVNDANGQDIQIGPRFRYLISDVTFTNATGESIVVEGHNLVDVADDKNLSYTPEMEIPAGEYTVSFTYGLKTEDNLDGEYADLNSASFSVPPFLGGGYHYMQLDGKYRDSAGLTQGYNYHNIRAVDPNMPDGPPTFPEQPTFINVNLGSILIAANTAIEVKMNVAEWFKGPNVWDLNVFNQMLMGNSTAQKMMNENGQNVFSLGAVTQ